MTACKLNEPRCRVHGDYPMSEWGQHANCQPAIETTTPRLVGSASQLSRATYELHAGRVLTRCLLGHTATRIAHDLNMSTSMVEAIRILLRRDGLLPTKGKAA